MKIHMVCTDFVRVKAFGYEKYMYEKQGVEFLCNEKLLWYYAMF